MLGNIISGFADIFTIQIMFLLIAGVAIGILFGAIPGLTATMAVALCLPLTFALPVIPSMALLVGLYIGGISGGLITAILLKIPGTPASIATTFDGHPMAEKGEAGKALSIGIISSFLGGLFSIIVLIFVSPPLAQIAIRFTPYDYFAVILFSLTMMAGLAGRSLVKGLLSGMLGMVFAMIGGAPIDGFPRFTAGIKELDAGFDLLPTLIGLFAISEIIRAGEETKLMKGARKTVEKVGQLYVSMKEMLSQTGNLLRSSVIGTAIGILPGIGGGVSNIISYTVARRQSKHPEKFGTGIPDGVVASETANNASIGGAMVPLLSLGIPGDTVTAMLIGAFMIQGISPGPMMFQMHSELVNSIFAALLVANLIMLVLMMGGLKIFVKLLNIPREILLPIIFAVCIIGVFGVNSRLFDVWTVLFFGIVGYVMEKFDFPLAPIILGFILGPILEENLRRGLMFSDGSILPFFTNPISAIFLALSVISVALSLRKGGMWKGQA